MLVLDNTATVVRTIPRFNARNADFESTSSLAEPRVTVSWSLATDETCDLRQTLDNAEGHVRWGREELERENEAAQERVEFLCNRRAATEHNVERRMREFRDGGWAGPEAYSGRYRP
ncbi:hypothetical protein CDV36_011476 [Fusarium kuroshium]|uniref:Uncharacterized protein n=2 Tax=Fusarium solani species complex TaxID=232080 RepID=A0A3M2RUG4_9HYPO|nr:hypothetical protein CDV36_011476 [Fusarium kuroshium]RSM09685.1 hypothetical protein CEP52_003945 [Fusarium oligoseptatum]